MPPPFSLILLFVVITQLSNLTKVQNCIEGLVHHLNYYPILTFTEGLFELCVCVSLDGIVNITTFLKIYPSYFISPLLPLLTEAGSSGFG